MRSPGTRLHASRSARCLLERLSAWRLACPADFPSRPAEGRLAQRTRGSSPLGINRERRAGPTGVREIGAERKPQPVSLETAAWETLHAGRRAPGRQTQSGVTSPCAGHWYPMSRLDRPLWFLVSLQDPLSNNHQETLKWKRLTTYGAWKLHGTPEATQRSHVGGEEGEKRRERQRGWAWTGLC